MRGFTIGMLAFVLWFAAVVGLFIVVRHAPGPAHRSIFNFRRARRRMAPAAVEAPDYKSPLAAPSESPNAPEWQEQTVSTFTLPFKAQPPDPSSDPAPESDTGSERPEISAVGASHPRRDVEEIEGLIAAVTSPEPRRRRSPEPKPPPRGPIRKGRITYVLFDEEGRPMLD